MSQIPVTVLTGYLGAGKTTLLNRILSEPHGKKYAVIVNEYGEAGIDGDLVVGADEEIFEMNNGCICCTVRGDLIRIISGLMKRASGFDGILIETTGLADPGPVAQTFFADADVAAKAKLDSIVTVVDAKHIGKQLSTILSVGAEAAPGGEQSRLREAQSSRDVNVQSRSSKEAEEQIAFADIVLLNKTDLVSKDDLKKVEDAIRRINRFAKIVRTERCKVPLDQILGLGSFDLNEILKHEPDFLGAKETHDEHCDDEHCDDPDHHHKHDHGHHHERDHEHDKSVISISLRAEKPLDLAKFEEWIGELRTTKGQDLLRYKGILDVAGSDRRLAIQGVHMMMEGSDLAPWKEGTKRQSRLVFIGRNLDEKTLRESFAACMAA